MKQLTPMDAQFYYSDTTNQSMIIGGLHICDQSAAPNGFVRHKDILQYIEDRLNTTSMYRRRLQKAPLSLDDPYWLDDENFDLEYHVRHVGLPQPGDWRQLCIFSSRIFARTIDMERAPWEMYIIEGLDNVEGVPKGSFAVLTKMHHAYVDGQSGLSMLESLVEDSAAHEFGRRDNIQIVEHAPSATEMWMRTAPRLLGQTLRSAKGALDFAKSGLAFAQSMSNEENRTVLRTAPSTRFGVKVSPHRVYDAFFLDLSSLKAIKQSVAGATINDTVISVLGGALRRYMSAKHELPDTSMISMCPVSGRPKDMKGEGGNDVSAMLVAVGTDIEDPIDRLTAVREETLKGIALAKGPVSGLLNALGEITPPIVRNLASQLQSKLPVVEGVANTVITNVPGFVGGSAKYFAGAPIVQSTPYGPVADGIGLFHAVSSYMGNVVIAVSADRAVMPDIDVYIQCIRDSFEEHIDAANAKVIADAEIAKAAAIEAEQAAAERKAAVAAKVKAQTSVV